MYCSYNERSTNSDDDDYFGANSFACSGSDELIVLST